MIIQRKYIFLLLVAIGGFCVEIFAQSTRPRWIDNPYSAHSGDNYLVAVGEDASRLDAENEAFANLVQVLNLILVR